MLVLKSDLASSSSSVSRFTVSTSGSTFKLSLSHDLHLASAPSSAKGPLRLPRFSFTATGRRLALVE
ncbi:hypothetical protein RIF29_05436 [Crotalaria pallida]|uniref:Uncharacterized protein n=1 Tax=Crotalaria pallida TaxID=3830 RepID=A0AAN9PAB6_CROPI